MARVVFRLLGLSVLDTRYVFCFVLFRLGFVSQSTVGSVSFRFGFVSFWFRFILVWFGFGFVSFWFRFAKYNKPLIFITLNF